MGYQAGVRADRRTKDPEAHSKREEGREKAIYTHRESHWTNLWPRIYGYIRRKVFHYDRMEWNIFLFLNKISLKGKETERGKIAANQLYL